MAERYIILLLVLLVSSNVIDGKIEIEDDEVILNAKTMKFPYNNIRLPGNVIPLDYTVYLHPNITDGNFRLTGYVKITVEVKKATDSIMLHSKSHTYEYVEVREFKKLKKVPIKGTLTHEKYEMLMVRLGEKLSAKQKYTLTIRFSGHLSSGLSGFYKSSYKTKSGEKKYIATSHFEATGARLAFPCFDEPAMKANFSIIMVREKIHTALSNMPIVKHIYRKDGLVEDVFQTSVKMSTYLVAFVVSDFAHLSTTSKRGVKIRVWAPKDLISQAKYAIEVTPKILDYYEKFFRINFPLPKQDLIAIPDFAAGAMENWGLITYRLTALLFDEKKSSSKAKQWVAAVIAHELAHQWFGNLVTMKWWNDIWLNEGFADYVQSIGTDVVGKTWKIQDQFVNDNNHRALALDSKLNSHPISVPVNDPAEIGALFDGISYSKGGSIIRMMRDFIGTERFLNGLASYLRKHKYQNAASDDLWESLSKATGNKINVKSIMDTWTLQMGYPVIKVKRDPKNKEMAIVTQDRFVTDVEKGKATKPSPFNYKWVVPLTYYFQNNKKTQRKWLGLKDKSVRIPWTNKSGWLKMNVNEVGFYRVNYDHDNWKALANQLLTDHTKLSGTDRSNLLNDAFALANTGRISQAQALDLTKYMAKEKNYVPFYSGMSSLGSIGGLLLHRPGFTYYEKYILKQISPLVHELGWTDSGSFLNKFLRILVLKSAVAHNMTSAVHNAREMYKTWMANSKRIPANFLSIVFAAGIKYGGQKEWNYMFDQYRTTINPSEKQTLMYALADSSDQKILSRYLQLTLDNNVIRPQDTCFVISAIARNSKGTKLAQNFVKKNWKSLFKRYGDHGIDRLISGVFAGGRTKAELSDTEKFLNGRELGGGKMSAKRTLANIRNNISWLEKHEKTVVQWLKNNL